MIVIGAKGHAKEILEIITGLDEIHNLFFFDDIEENKEKLLFNKFPILKNKGEVKDVFKKDNRFVLGIGNPKIRHKFVKQFEMMGGLLTSIFSKDVNIGSWNCKIDKGVNVMSKVFISNDVYIEEGVLLNTACHVHHDSFIGKYCEISPMACILGNCYVGEFSSIGTGAIILPKIIVGRNVVVGAGAIVTKNVPDNGNVKGIPAKKFKLQV